MIDPQAGYIGSMIRKARIARKLRLADLGEKTRLSVSFLSQVERGLMNPSLNSLRMIALALEIPLSSFFDEVTSSKGPVVRKNERRILINKNSRLTYQLISPDFIHRIEFLLTRLEVGASSAESPLTHKGDEAALILQGECRFELGNDIYDLKEGDTIYIVENTPHRFTNIGNVPLIIVSAISPPSF